jgi:hypothetical protein
MIQQLTVVPTLRMFFLWQTVCQAWRLASNLAPGMGCHQITLYEVAFLSEEGPQICGRFRTAPTESAHLVIIACVLNLIANNGAIRR